ncbi:MAG: acyloxyacyl hydrolase [Betaproteobacteria bacterium]|nr:acyloxyacyl hydrolase [Betaproteobacteria bacterium]
MKKLSALMFSTMAMGQAYAVDGVSIEYGKGNSADMVRVGALWNWDKSWLNDGDWHITGFWDASLGQWRGKSSVGNNQTVTDIGITPVFRFEQKNPSGMAPYVEGAIGFHLISPAFIYANRKFGSSFQFGDHVGFGVRLGDRRQFDLGYRYQHLSNGSIKEPNHGINFNQIHLDYYF